MLHVSTEQALHLRQELMRDARRVVVKVGSQLLTNIPGTTKQERIRLLVAELALLREAGIEVILVTSGAIGAGMKLLGDQKRPTDLGSLQARAAIGQSRLMSLYEQACQEHGFHCGQMLLSADDVKDRKRHLNIRNCLSALLSEGVLPIINENDTVSVEEICFGDNDRLAALVGTMVRADLVVLLTTINGLRERTEAGLGKRLSVVQGLTEAIRRMAKGTDGNPFSVGGMRTKLDAADITCTSGEYMWIVDGADFSVLRKVMSGEDIGTLFVPVSARISGNKRFLLFFTDPVGRILVDTGAERALKTKGKSLLPSGITNVEGAFEKGDTVDIINPDGVVIGTGVSNYSASDLNQIKGHKSKDFETILGRGAYDEAIHRDNLVMTES